MDRDFLQRFRLVPSRRKPQRTSSPSQFFPRRRRGTFPSRVPWLRRRWWYWGGDIVLVLVFRRNTTVQFDFLSSILITDAVRTVPLSPSRDNKNNVSHFTRAESRYQEIIDYWDPWFPSSQGTWKNIYKNSEYPSILKGKEPFQGPDTDLRWFLEWLDHGCWNLVSATDVGNQLQR